jgi:hypothetical protein
MRDHGVGGTAVHHKRSHDVIDLRGTLDVDRCPGVGSLASVTKSTFKWVGNRAQL